MRILVVGAGGREHALAWAIARSPLTSHLFAAPGNAGIAQIADCIDIAAEDVNGLAAFARDARIDLVVVGPEGPLVLGLVDRLRAEGIPVFGPTAAAAILEGSKKFTKELCAQMGIPTGAHASFQEPEAAKAYVRRQGAPIVVKADGLAAGKGVTVAMTEAEALDAVDAMLTDGAFGEAGATVVVEAFLDGPEVSFFALVDGRTAIPFASAADHKRAFDNDEGPNTGGMGAYSPTPLLDVALEREVMERIIHPTVRGMADAGRPFAGVLYAGLILTRNGPQLLEYNVRFGDPECQVLMARLDCDIVPVLQAAAEGRLDQIRIAWKPGAALTVVMAANGYPGAYEKGSVIRGLEAAEALPDVTVFHAGTKRGADGRIEAHGGRVLGVTATGADIAEARTRAYQAVDRIDWPAGFCRRDIGAKASG
ncbi:MAG: phosphoribosylamine--glycine ligase [Azospirillaceae bacterium]